MNERAKKYLSDSLQAINLIEEFVADVPTFEAYLSDRKTQSAVERQLGIIGEAVNRFRKQVEEHKLSNATEIVGFRNRLIHSYDGLDESIVWAVVKNHLPGIKEEIEREMNE